MTFSIDVTLPEAPPLQADDNGAIRIGDTRVMLDIVIGAYQLGNTAEEIAKKFPVLALKDIYASIAYYLRHREEIDAYLQERRRIAESLRDAFESNSNVVGIRERLLARQAKSRRRESGTASDRSVERRSRLSESRRRAGAVGLMKK